MHSSRIDTILEEMNAYHGENIYTDVVYYIPEYDEVLTERMDPGMTGTSYFMKDGTEFYWDSTSAFYPDGEWRATDHLLSELVDMFVAVIPIRPSKFYQNFGVEIWKVLNDQTGEASFRVWLPGPKEAFSTPITEVVPAHSHVLLNRILESAKEIAVAEGWELDLDERYDEPQDGVTVVAARRMKD